MNEGFVAKEYVHEEGPYYIRNKQIGEQQNGWRSLTSDEVMALERNGNYSSCWSDVLVSEVFDVSCVRNSKFYGLVRIGNISEGLLQYDHLQLPIGIYNSIVVATDLGDNVAVHNVQYLANYIVGKETILFNIKEMRVTPTAKFGNGVIKEGEDADSRLVLTVMNEAGGREIAPFEDMIAADAYMWARYIDDKELQGCLVQMTQASQDAKQGYYGMVGNGVVIKNTVSIVDVKVGDSGVVDGANRLQNITIKSSEAEPSNVSDGAILKNGIVGYGCHLHNSCIAENFVLGNNSALKNGARLMDSFVGDNSTIACCEVLNNLVFPAHEQHHNNSFLIASLVMGQSNIAAGATVGSNHNSRTNDNEIQAGRGFWPGLCASLKHSSRFASYTLLAKAQYPAEIDNPFPFSLVNNNPSRDELEIMPAYWWMYNMYALARNSWKYTARDKRKNKLQNIEFNAYAPDTMEEAAYAMTLLERWTAKAWHIKNGTDVTAITNQELEEQGKELLTGDKDKVKNLEVLAEGVEKGNRKVRILKVYDAYHAYYDMIVYYAITNVINYVQDKEDVSCEGLHSALVSSSTRHKKWINLGGQLVREADFVQLVNDIKAKTLDSWAAVHARYNALWDRYAKDKAEHAYMLMCDVFGVESMPQEEWLLMLDKAIDIQKYVCDQVYISRKKDYDNPFRKCTFRNDDEMIAAIGSIESNKFIVQIQEDTKVFNAKVNDFMAKIRK